MSGRPTEYERITTSEWSAFRRGYAEQVERIVAGKIAAAKTDALAPILALVDVWEQDADAVCCDYCQNSVAARRDAADAIRDALARPAQPTPGGAA